MPQIVVVAPKLKVVFVLHLIKFLKFKPRRGNLVGHAGRSAGSTCNGWHPLWSIDIVMRTLMFRGNEPRKEDEKNQVCGVVDVVTEVLALRVETQNFCKRVCALRPGRKVKSEGRVQMEAIIRSSD